MNILEILKDKPQGTILYSPICGECKLLGINSANIKIIKDNFYYNFNEEGKYASNGECLLFPSKEMRDWNKFAWKKGDVLVNKDGDNMLFSHWLDSNYTTFVGIYHTNKITYDTSKCLTEEWALDLNQGHKDRFIHNTELKFGGKLNLETLEIEKKEHEFKPFDRVLCRDDKNELWRIDIFRFLRTLDNIYKYQCMANHYKYCIPYEGNEHLCNTNKNPQNDNKATD